MEWIIINNEEDGSVDFYAEEDKYHVIKRPNEEIYLPYILKEDWDGIMAYVWTENYYKSLKECEKDFE